MSHTQNKMMQDAPAAKVNGEMITPLTKQHACSRRETIGRGVRVSPPLKKILSIQMLGFVLTMKWL